MARKRLHEIDSMTGLAILLVVLGHLANPDTYPVVVGSDFYFRFKHVLYKFHMPFFMFLSGVVFFYTYKPVKTIYEYMIFVKKKFNRLIPSFLFFGTLTLVGKMIISGSAHVDNFTSNNMLENFYNLIFMPMSSSARSLWYIYVLFEYYVIFSLAVLVLKQRLYVLIILGVTLYFAQIQSPFLGINQFSANFIFFSFGTLFMKHYEKLKVNFLQYRHVYMLLFLASFSVMGRVNHHYSMFIIGSFSIPAIYGYVAFYMKTNHVLQYISTYTFSIYLMNMMFSGLIIGILVKIMPLRDMTFNVLFPFIALLTIVGIIFVKNNFFKYLPTLDRMTN